MEAQPAPAAKPGSASDLLARARAGDDVAFAGLIEGHAVRLLLFIRRQGAPMLGPDCAAEDVLQTVVARAWQSLGSFEGAFEPGGFYRWLLAHARNALGDRLRYLDAKGRDGIRHLGGAGDSQFDQAAAVPASITSVASRAAWRERAALVGRALAGLPPRRRDVIVHCVIESRSLAEAADAVGVSKTMAWKELQLGLSSLRSLLGADHVH